MVPNQKTLMCDGCGQLVDSLHISRRLGRLEWATRYRPVHIQALLLGGVVPPSEAEFVYAPGFAFAGEGAEILRAVQIATEGKSREAVQTELQKLGVLLTHVLECPLEESAEPQALIEKQLPAAVARIRRSLKPKRVLLLSPELAPYARKLHEAELGCPVLPSPEGVFLATRGLLEEEMKPFRKALGLANV